VSARKGWGGPKRLAETLPRIAGEALRRQGFAEAEIVLRWPAIVGAELASASLPERLRFRGEGAVLTIRVEPARATELQHLLPVLIDRLNGYFGYAAVKQIQLLQAPLPAPAVPAPVPPPLTPAALAAAEARLPTLRDTALRQALAQLAARLTGPAEC